MVVRFTVPFEVFLVFMGGGECSGTTQKFMTDIGLVFVPLVLEDRRNVMRGCDSKLEEIEGSQIPRRGDRIPRRGGQKCP